MSNNSARKKDDRDNTIIALLDILGQRMLDSEGERIDMREKLEALFEQSGDNEQACLSLQHKLNHTEATSKTVAKRQKEIENLLESQADKVERAYAMTEKIEEAMAQQARINRRLDKLVQDKTRMIGKLDRIEETVIETQEALHANAMVMLSGRDAPHIPVDMSQKHKDSSNVEDTTWWQRAFSPQNAGVAAMVSLAIFCGWGLSQIPYTELANSYQNNQNAAVVASNETNNDAGDEQSFENVLANIAPAAAPDAETIAAETTVDNGMDLFENNTDAELLSQMEEDPDALAAALNEIEPGTGATPPENLATNAVQEKIEDTETAPVAEAKVTKAALPTPLPAKTEVKEPNVNDFIAAQAGKGSIASRITPDAGLPDVIKLIEDKAFEGIAEAQHDLAAIYTAGHGGVTIDYEKAATWFREAAVNGVANARYNLGVLYHQGLGVPQNIDTAFGWYRAAAKAGHPEAQYNLGIAYIEGIGTPYDPAKAADNFKNAAKAGILEAAYNLGLIYENGLLGSAEPGEALKWYKLSADLGSAEGKTALEQLAKIMEVDPKNVKAYTVTQQKSGQNAAPSYATDSTPPQKQTSAPQTQPATKAASNTNDKNTELSVGTLRPEDILQSIDNSAETAESIIETFPTLPASALTDVSDNMHKDQAVLAQIQEQLMRVGLYPGPADGMMGPMTADAILSYQEMYDLPHSGKPSQALLVHMLAGEIGSSLPQYGSREDE